MTSIPRLPLKLYFKSLFAGSMLLLFLFSSCKKESGDETYRDEELAPLGTCAPVTSTGTMSVNQDGSFEYTTAGGGTISFSHESGILIKHKDYSNFKLEFWGYMIVDGQNKFDEDHENLNGKHVKNRLSTTRSFLFPDGAKVTWIADSVYGKVNSVTIFEGTQTHHFNTTCNKLERSVPNAIATKQLDDLQPDGETSTIEISSTGLLFVTLYIENTAGNKEPKRVLIGELFLNEPNHLNDYYDDPRLGAT